jgi:hypothetical protein
MKVVHVGSIPWRVGGHAMSSHCLWSVVSLGVCWRTPASNIWKLEYYLLRLWGIYVNIEVILWSAYVSFTSMLEMLHMWGMLIGASWQRCLVNVRWVTSTLCVILMHLGHIVLHVASSTLLRMTRNMMMYMWMNNVTCYSLPISDLIIHLYAILLVMVRIVVALLVFIRNHLRLTIIFTLTILTRLQSTKKGTGMITRSVLINRRWDLRSTIGLLLLAFHDNILKKLNSFLHAISLIQPIWVAWLPSLSKGCIRGLILRGIKIHRLMVHILLVIWCINLLLVLIESFLVCSPLAKELFLLGISFHLSSFFYLSFPWWL